MLRRTAAVTLSLVVAVLAVAVVATPARADTPWVSLSDNPADNGYPRTITYDLPTIARFGSSVQAVWRAQDGVSGESYWTAVMGAGGQRTLSPLRIPAVTGWSGLQESPRLLANGSQRLLVFSGVLGGSGPEEFSEGTAYYSIGASATDWDMGQGSLSHTTSAYPSEGSDAAIADGTPVWVGNPGSPNGLTWHVGISGDVPAPAGSDGVHRCDGCHASDAAAARDPATGEVFGAFYADGGAAAGEGIWVGRIAPSEAGFDRAPGSYATRGGSIDSLAPEQRVALVGRNGGGVYAAYRTGFPAPATSITLWRVGTPAGIPVPGSAGARSVSLAAEPDGRLWVVWTDDAAGRVHAVRTDPGVTRFGAVRTISAPPEYGQVWHTVADARAGAADVVVTAQNGNGAINVFHREVSPGLSLAVRATARPGRPTRLRVGVTDAGSAVVGATVRAGTATSVTGPDGFARLDVTGSRVAVVARAIGYAPGRASVLLR